MQRKLSTNGCYRIVSVLGKLIVPSTITLSLSWNDLHCSNVSADEMLYTEAELAASMPRIETINFHQV